jgi:uncharacterized membrane protein YoaK (UPF0700 family)
LLCTPWSSPQRAWRSLIRILLLEVIVFGSCALLWTHSPRSIDGGALYAVIALASLSMGIQAVAARSINASGISTVVFTTGLIRIVIAATNRLRGRRGSVMQAAGDHGHLLAFAAYGCGAVLTGMFIAQHIELLIWSPMAAVLVALAGSIVAHQLQQRTAA